MGTAGICRKSEDPPGRAHAESRLSTKGMIRSVLVGEPQSWRGG